MLHKQLGSYRITRKLAEGGMGEVFVAQHELMDREAVVKVLHPKLSHDEEVVRRFLNEARAAASISHPGIVAIYDLGRTEGQVYIVMERLHGETLAERIARAPIEVDQVMAMSRQLASALAAAHARDIVHRDLKPENIFVIADPDVPGGERIKVLDFGVAKLAPTQGGGNLTAQGTLFGTPAYMAPEQCENAAEVDHRTDLYAIGCIMYEMLCGQPPFGKGGLELLAAHLRDQPRPPSAHVDDIPEDLEDAILKLLAKKPDHRFQSCEDLLAALGGAELGPRTRPSGVISRPDLAYAATVMPSPSQPPAPADAGTDPARAMSLSPTTYRSASGQVDTLPSQGAGRRLGLLVAAALGAAGAAALIYLLVLRDQGATLTGDPAAGAQATAGHTAAGSGQADARVEPPADAAPPPGRAFLDQAEDALAERRWEDALVAAAQVIAVAPEGSDAAQRARAIQETARQGQKDALSYEIFRQAAQAQDVRTAVYAYEQLGDDSLYHDDATEDYRAMRDAWLEPRLERARALVDRGRCGKLPPLAQEVGFLFPESAGAVRALHQECRDHKQARSRGEDRAPDPAQDDPGGSDAEAGEPAAEGLPEKLTRDQVLAHLRPIRKKLLACKRRFHREEPATLNFEISPEGALKTIAMDAGVPFKRCLWLQLRTIEFPPAQDVTQVTYPLGRHDRKTRRRRRRR